MNKHTIEIEGLPTGWEPVAARIDPGHEYGGDDGNYYMLAKIKLQKIQPRRIVQRDDYDPSSPNGFD